MNWPDDFINKIICGDCLEVMKEMPAESIDMILTSPPYWGLRDYGNEQIFGGNSDCEHEWGERLPEHHPGQVEQTIWKKAEAAGKGQTTGAGNYCQKCQAWKGQLGLEPTPELYIEHLTEIFNEVKRVLKKEGTLWLNIGDTYWSAKGSCFNPGGGENSIETSIREIYPLNRGNKSDVPNLPPKCLTMIPERLAWSLIQNGWVLRNKNIWHKRNSMPSSVKDRFSNKWEYVYCFVKSNKAVYWTNGKTGRLVTKQPLGIKGLEGLDWEWKGVGVVGKNVFNVRVRDADKERFMQKATEKEKKTYGKSKLKKVSLWTAHDYYFDLDSVREPYTESSITRISQNQGNPKWNGNHKRGSPMGKHTLDPKQFTHPKGKNPGDVWVIGTVPCPIKGIHFATFPEELCKKAIIPGCPEGGIVLDPFCGIGTACYVARKLGREFIGVDIKPEYCDKAENIRLAQGVL